MKESGYLTKRILLLWRFKKIPAPTNLQSYQAKVNLVTGKLAKFAQDAKQPLALILNEYAYFYGYLSKETSLNKIYLRLGEFMDSYTAPQADINGDDIEMADQVEKDWNEMHDATMSDFPFTLRTVMLKSGIKIRGNTFFKHDHNFKDFCVIANFVRHNRRVYPQIHGMKEFFVHLPIIWRKPAEYIVWQYVNPEKTLDKYYQKIYGDTPKPDRFPRFLELLKGTDIVHDFKDVWGIKEIPPATKVVQDEQKA